MGTAVCFALVPRGDAGLVKNPNFVLSGEYAYVLQPAVPISAGGVEQIKWSSTGQYLLVVRTEVDAAANPGPLPEVESRELRERSIVIYSVEERKSTVIWRAKGLGTRLDSINWLADSNRAVAIIDEDLRTEDPSKPRPNRQSVLLIDAAKTSMAPVLSLVREGQFPLLSFDPSPTKAYGLLTLMESNSGALVPSAGAAPPPRQPEPLQFRVLRADGTLGSTLKLDQPYSPMGWTADGTSPVLTTFARKASLVKVNFVDGSVLPQPDNAPMWQPNAKAQPVTAERERSKTVTTNGEITVYPTWLVSPAENLRALVTPDSVRAELSPTLSGIAYESNGLVGLRRIVKMPRKAFLAALVAAERDRLVRNGKQVALAALMYGSDADDSLPLKDMDIASVLGPYAKDLGIFDGFVYTYPGGPLTDLKSPATTEMGYISGPGGKAVVYADGHVKWISDK